MNVEERVLNIEKKIAEDNQKLHNDIETLDINKKVVGDENPKLSRLEAVRKLSGNKLKLDIKNKLDNDQRNCKGSMKSTLTKKLQNKQATTQPEGNKKKLDNKELTKLVRAKWKIVNSKVLKNSNEVIKRKQEEVQPSNARKKVSNA